MIGKTVSHYKIMEELGRGGMGVVYKALDVKLDRLVALKFLPPQISSDEEEKKRFIHEAKAASALDHPNICSVYEIGETPEGQLFIAMGCYEGKTLKEKIKASPLSVHDAVEIAVQIAEGLKKAHGKGIVHRDLKPANVMLTDEGSVKIVDFGLAKQKGQTKLTKTGTTLGTVAYMSPEQAMAKEVDQRTDIWSLGVILYEMLTGKLPFKGEYDQAVIYAILNEEPEPVTALRSGIPLELERLINKALAKDPAERYQDCQDLLADLKRSMKEGKSTSTRSGASAGLHQRHFPWAWLSLIVLLVMAMAYAGFLLTRKKPAGFAAPEASPSPAPAWTSSIAVLPFRDFSSRQDQEYFCDGMTDALIGRLTHIRELKVISLTSVMAYKNKERNINKIARELGVTTVLDGNVQREKDRIRISAQLISAADQANLWSDHYDRNLASVFEVHDDISRAIATALKFKLLPQSQETPGASTPKNMDAYEYYMKGMHFIKTKYVLTFRDEDFQAGVGMFNKAIAIEPDYAMAYFGLCYAYEHHYQVTGAKSDSRLARKYSEIFYRLDPGSALSNALTGYMLYEYQGQYEQGFVYLKKALESNANIGEVNFLAGMCYLYAGLYDPGIHYLTRAVELDPYYLWGPYKLACCFMGAGDYEKAARNFEKYFALTPIEPLIWPGKYLALNIWMKRYGKADEILARGAARTPDAEWVRKFKAILLAEKGEREKALALYRNSEVYALLGMADEAFQELHKEIRGTEAIPYIYYSYLQHNPFYDKLRSDPRFLELLARERKLHDEYMAKYGTQPAAGKNDRQNDHLLSHPAKDQGWRRVPTT
jgi:serine/threonine protein kinase/tetratricopeptide (TPR) repeat protein